jgi:hypothetical protein
MSVLRSTKSPISMRNGTLQLKVAPESSGKSLWNVIACG